MSFLPTGTVYGIALDFSDERQARGHPGQAAVSSAASEVHAPTSVEAALSAPLLYIKPANTFTPHGQPIALPAGAAEVWVGATVSMVFGPFPPVSATSSAIERVAGYVLMNDLSLPRPDLLRSLVRYNCIDGFLGIGDQIVPADQAGDPAAFVLEVRIDGELKQTIRFADLPRRAAQLVADVSGFMTLREGDVLMLGTDVLASGQHLSARAGQRIDISAAGFPTLSNTLIAETA